MQNVNIILNHLKKYSNSNGKVEKLYRHLYNPEFYKLAISNIYSKSGNNTFAGHTIITENISDEDILKLCNKLKNQIYKPTILENNKFPSLNDKLVQEIIRILLEVLYEDNFSQYSFGYRPNKSVHNCLEDIRNRFKGTKWFLTIDLNNQINNLNHTVLLNTLKEKIKDDRFIHLINLFLKAGYINQWDYSKTYSGTPIGTIISQILVNIYLDKFDKKMEEIKNTFDIGNRRKSRRDYNFIASKLSYTRRMIESGKTDQKYIDQYNEYNRKFKEWKGSTQEPIDPDYQRIHYIRYFDKILISMISSKENINILKKWLIYDYFNSFFKLDISNNINLYYNSEKVRFLNYDIIVVRNDQKKLYNGKIKLSVPYDIMVNFIISNRFGKWWKSPLSGKDELKAIHRPELINLDPLEIMYNFHDKIKSLYNYYKLAENVYKLCNFGYIVTTSYMRTLCAKYKTSRAKLYANKNFRQNKRVGYLCNNKFYELYQGPYKKVRCFKFEKNIDIKPDMHKYYSRNSLIKRIETSKNGKCYYCGNIDGPFHEHHTNKIKNMDKSNPFWKKLLISRQRKTITLCKNCHYKLHAGKL